MDLVSIVIPTFNRQKSLARALASACGQVLPETIAIEIIVVDNSVDGNAKDIVAEQISSDGMVRYLGEPNPGVATARNTGVRESKGRWIAFLDDDEEASAGWIAALVAVARQSGADAVFGPVEASSDGERAIGDLAPYFSRRIDRPDATIITDLAAYLGTNNSLFDRLKCLARSEPFDTGLNEVGGEDSLLLKRLVMEGCQFAWASRATVIEWVAARRLNWAYVRKRKFLSGQIRVFVLQMAGGTSWHNIVLWMGVGLAQFLIAGAATLLLWPFMREKAEMASTIACGGLGKVLWAPRFRPALYGTGLVS